MNTTKTIATLFTAAAAIWTTVMFPTVATAEPILHKCGAPIKSFVKTDIAAFQTNSTSFQAIPGAFIAVKVPAGETQCIKVRFSAVAACAENAAVADVCAVRVVEPGQVALDPAVNGINFIVEDASASAHSFEWVKEFEAGNHRIEVQAAVQNSATTMRFFTWTMDVEVTK